MSFDRKVEIIKLFAEFGKRYNSYYQLKYKIHNMIDSEDYELTISNQFLAVDLRFPQFSGRIAHWRLKFDALEKWPSLSKYELVGENRDRHIFDFFLPEDFFSIFSELVAYLGDSYNFYNAVMTSSGRSVWVFPPEQLPFCLKIDTFDFDLPQKFSSRPLRLAQIKHSAKLNNLLKAEKNIFSEGTGCSFTFEEWIDAKTHLSYSYLIRDLNFEQNEIKSKDFIIPVQAILSEDFWKDTRLLKIIEMHKRQPVEFFKTDLAKGFADLIFNSLNTTHIHFEVHQQNMSLQIRNGKLVKLLYHDLLDTVFDPIGFFMKSVGSDHQNNLNLLQVIDDMQANVFFNSHGLLQRKNDRHHTFTVSSFYRRYIRNFGDYSKVFNAFSGGDYLQSFEFEECILKYLNFGESSLCLSALPINTTSFLSRQLFWSIDRYHIVHQKNEIQAKLNLLQKLSEIRPRGNAELCSKFFVLLNENNCFGSASFPIKIDFLQADHLEDLQSLYDDRVFIGKYMNEPFIVIVPTPSKDVNLSDRVECIL